MGAGKSGSCTDEMSSGQMKRLFNFKVTDSIVDWMPTSTKTQVCRKSTPEGVLFHFHFASSSWRVCHGLATAVDSMRELIHAVCFRKPHIFFDLYPTLKTWYRLWSD